MRGLRTVAYLEEMEIKGREIIKPKSVKWDKELKKILKDIKEVSDK